MSEIRTYRNLEAWQRAMEVALLTYALADKLPASEKYELSRQMRRAATSIPANVAEGHARRGKSYLYHVRVALGSLAELQTHVEIAIRLHFLTPTDLEDFFKKTESAAQLLHGLRRSLVLKLLSESVVLAGIIFLTVVVG